MFPTTYTVIVWMLKRRTLVFLFAEIDSDRLIPKRIGTWKPSRTLASNPYADGPLAY